MGDCIRREDLYKRVLSAYITAERFGFELGKDVVLLAIKQQPAADVVEVRHGRWIPAQDYSNGNEDIECSSCGEWFKSLELCGRLGEPNYCPVCGSKNKDGGAEE